MNECREDSEWALPGFYILDRHVQYGHLDLIRNPIFCSVPVLYRVKQTRFFKLQHKAMDGSIGGIAEVLFQLLGEELSFNIRGKSKIPRRFFLFCDLSQGQGGLKHIGHLYSGKCTVQLMVYIFNEIHKEVALDCATVEKLVLYKITSLAFYYIDAPLQMGNILNWHGWEYITCGNKVKRRYKEENRTHIPLD